MLVERTSFEVLSISGKIAGVRSPLFKKTSKVYSTYLCKYKYKKPHGAITDR